MWWKCTNEYFLTNSSGLNCFRHTDSNTRRQQQKEISAATTTIAIVFTKLISLFWMIHVRYTRIHGCICAISSTPIPIRIVYVRQPRLDSHSSSYNLFRFGAEWIAFTPPTFSPNFPLWMMTQQSLRTSQKRKRKRVQGEYYCNKNNRKKTKCFNRNENKTHHRTQQVGVYHQHPFLSPLSTLWQYRKQQVFIRLNPRINVSTFVDRSHIHTHT